MTAPEQDLKARLDFAVGAARQASELILQHYQADDLSVDLKQDHSPVTIADRGAEELLRAEIDKAFPDDGVLGEEFGEKASANGYRWILDPVDGTKSFVHGVPLFGTLIGLEHQGAVVVGVCRIPALDEVVYAAQGHGAWWQVGDAPAKPARVTQTDRLDKALFCFTEIEGWRMIERVDTFLEVCRACRITRGWGDCYGHILVATGRADVMIDPLLNPWDAAALVPILQEAGGHFVDWSGTANIYTGNGMSVNENLKNEVLQLLQ